MQTDVAAVDLAMGVLTVEQASAQLSFGFPKGSDAVLQTLRLICRGSLPAVKLAGQWRIPVEALKNFFVSGGAADRVNKASGLTAETIAPVFPLAGEWFGAAPWRSQVAFMLSALLAELEKQLPSSRDAVAKDQLRAAGAIQVSEFPAVITPEIRQILATPLPPAGGIFNRADGSMFKNTGEVFLCMALIGETETVLISEGHANSQDINMIPRLSQLYESPESFVRIVKGGLARVANPLTFAVNSGLMARRTFNPPTAEYAKPVRDPISGQPHMELVPAVEVTILPDFQKMAQAAGTNPARIAWLAF